MDTQFMPSHASASTVRPVVWARRLVWFVAFLICDLAIMIFGSNYFDVFPTNMNLTYNLSLSALCLVAALGLRFTPRWKPYWLIAWAFFVASLAYPIALLLDGWISSLLGRLALTVGTSPGMAIEKVCEVIAVVVPILVLTKLAGADWGEIFIRRGNLKLGLGIGGLVLVFLATASFMFGATRFSSTQLLGEAVVWGLVFSLANGFMEELWLRGIFLKRFVPLLGDDGAVWLTAVVFALLHGFAFYFTPAALPFFMLNTLALGLACGYLMIKADNLWGALLIHAASDFFLFIAVLANA